MAMLGNTAWVALCHASIARKAEAARLAALGRPVRLAHQDGRRALAQADMSGSDPFRVTWFDKHGPSGHCGHNTLQAAIMDALRAGYTDYQKGA